MKEADALYKPRFAYTLLAAVILAWGANWPIMKVGLSFMPPLWFATTRLLLGSVTIFLILLITGRLRLPPRQDLSVFLSVSIFHMAGWMALAHIGLLYVPAGRSVVLAYTTPLWITPVAYFFLGEDLTFRKTVGLIIGLLGLAVLFNPMGFQWGDRDSVFGNLLLIGSAISWSVAILHVRYHKWKSSPLQLALWQMLLATVLLALLANWMYDIRTTKWTGQLIAALIYNGPIATAFCYWAALTVARSLPTISTSVGFQGVPVAGVLFSAVFLGEALTLTLTCGLVMIVGGMTLVNIPDQGSRQS